MSTPAHIVTDVGGATNTVASGLRPDLVAPGRWLTHTTPDGAATCIARVIFWADTNVVSTGTLTRGMPFSTDVAVPKPIIGQEVMTSYALPTPNFIQESIVTQTKRLVQPSITATQEVQAFMVHRKT